MKYYWSMILKRVIGVLLLVIMVGGLLNYLGAWELLMTIALLTSITMVIAAFISILYWLMTDSWPWK